MKRPAQRTALRIKRAYFARRHASPAIICNERPDNDQAAIKRRRRTDPIFAVILRLPSQSVCKLHLALFPKARPQFSRASIDTHQPRVRGTDENGVACKRHSTISEVAVIAA